MKVKDMLKILEDLPPEMDVIVKVMKPVPEELKSDDWPSPFESDDKVPEFCDIGWSDMVVSFTVDS